ncbi:Uncharacterised protein [uncultured archaeon]|nr:Uncharacterised protein [uncultured archaeon]
MFSTNLTSIIISSYDTQHCDTRDISRNSPHLSRFCEWFIYKENGAHVSENSTTFFNIFPFVFFRIFIGIKISHFFLELLFSPTSISSISKLRFEKFIMFNGVYSCWTKQRKIFNQWSIRAIFLIPNTVCKHV